MKDQISQELDRFAVETRYEDLPQDIVEKFK